MEDEIEDKLRNTHTPTSPQRIYLSKRFTPIPSPLKVARVLAFLSNELGFSCVNADITQLKNSGWPQTESEWTEAESLYQSSIPLLTNESETKEFSVKLQNNEINYTKVKSKSTAQLVTETNLLVQTRLQELTNETVIKLVRGQSLVNSRSSVDTILHSSPGTSGMTSNTRLARNAPKEPNFGLK